MCVAWLLLLSQCMVFPWTEPLHLLWEPHQVDSLDTHIHWNSGIQRPKQQTFIFSRCLKQQQIDQRLWCSVIVTKLKTSAEFGSYKALTIKKTADKLPVLLQISYRKHCMLYGARLHHHFTNNCFIYAVKLMNREKNIEEMEKQSNCLTAATLFRGIYQQINS